MFKVLGTLGVTLLRNMLTDKRKIPKQGVIRAGKGNIWASEETIERVKDFW